MCKKAVGNYSHVLEFARLLEGSKKYNKAINTYHSTSSWFLNAIGFKKCVIKLLVLAFYI